MRVEADIFSGRPNPTWELTAEEGGRFTTLFASLQRPADARAPTADGLGYRGFVVRPDGGSLDGYDLIRVRGQTVVAHRGDRTDTFADPGRTLEIWLLGSARNHLDRPTTTFLEGQVAPR